MRKIRYVLIGCFLIISLPSFCQTTGSEYYLTLNGNLHLPRNNTQKGVYPILGYNKNTDAKVLIGGMGVGFAAIKPLKNKISLHLQGNLSKQTYWDEPLQFTDENGVETGHLLAGSSDYTLGVLSTVHYLLTKRISVGTGLGGQLLLVSLSRLPKINNNEKLIGVNRHYKPFMPTLPVELTGRLRKTMFTVRYEHGLLNRLKGDVKEFKNDRFGLLVFELGFRIN